MKKYLLRSAAILSVLSINYGIAICQNAPATVVAGIPVNYDESKVGTYTLPDPLVMLNGKKVKNAKAWNDKRRPEIVRLFEEYQYGKTPSSIDHMTHPTRYQYQFAGNWRNYREDPSKSPVDAHMLVALMAPRPLLLQTGDTDGWSDPKGEFLAAVAAGPVNELLGKKGPGTGTWPAAGEPVLNDLGYYMHAGGHGAMPGDYRIFIEFIKKYFFPN